MLARTRTYADPPPPLSLVLYFQIQVFLVLGRFVGRLYVLQNFSLKIH